jgi:hypothetical protein
VEPDVPKVSIKPSPVAVVIATTLAAVIVPLMMLCDDSLNLTRNNNQLQTDANKLIIIFNLPNLRFCSNYRHSQYNWGSSQ